MKLTKVPVILALSAGMIAPAAAVVTAVPASATSAHRACSITWHDKVKKGKGGNVSAWVSAMKPDGCGTVHSKALCKTSNTSGRTVIGTPNITAAQGGTSWARCKNSETLAAAWVVSKGVAHRVY